MKSLFGAWMLILFLLGCGTSSKQPKVVIGEPLEQNPVVVIDEPPVVENVIGSPTGAITANFVTNSTPFYAYVSGVDNAEQKTTISFESKAIPKIEIMESRGAELFSLRFEEFDRDLLLVRTIYSDPIFRKYYLYLYKNSQWKEVVDGFILHESNISFELDPIEPNKDQSNYMKRFYSVFDLDPNSKTKYTWILKSESVPILNR